MVRNSRFRRDWKKSHSQSVLKKWMSARLIHFLASYFCSWIGVSWWRERVSAVMEIGKKSVWRRRIYRKYVSWNRLQKKQDEIYADIVLSRSLGSPGQWFPETDYLCASAIFVMGTLNYRSVKSNNLKQTHKLVHTKMQQACSKNKPTLGETNL